MKILIMLGLVLGVVLVLMVGCGGGGGGLISLFGMLVDDFNVLMMVIFVFIQFYVFMFICMVCYVGGVVLQGFKLDVVNSFMMLVGVVSVEVLVVKWVVVGDVVNSYFVQKFEGYVVVGVCMFFGGFYFDVNIIGLIWQWIDNGVKQ